MIYLYMACLLVLDYKFTNFLETGAKIFVIF